MVKKYLTPDDIGSYQKAFVLSNEIWGIVAGRDNLAKYSIGVQYVKSIDSISANIAEGFGRYFKKDKIKFYYYSRGSVIESIDWTEKSWSEKLLTQEKYSKIINELKSLVWEISHLIKYTNNKLGI